MNLKDALARGRACAVRRKQADAEAHYREVVKNMPTDPAERARYKTRHFATLYGVGPTRLAALLAEDPPR